MSTQSPIDIIGHEFTHLVIYEAVGHWYSQQNGLGPTGESGALAESFADIFGILIKFASVSGPSPAWSFGEDLVQHNGPIRRLGDPKKVFEASYAQMQQAVRALVRRGIESGDIRKDLDPADLIHALVGVSNVAGSADWQRSARRLVDILIAGSRPTE